MSRPRAVIASCLLCLLVVLSTFELSLQKGEEDYDSDEFEGRGSDFFSQTSKDAEEDDTSSSGRGEASSFDGPDEDDEVDAMNTVQLPIMHSLDFDGGFVPRGKLTYKGPKHVTVSRKKAVSVTVSSATLQGAELEKFWKLVELDGLYRIQIPSNITDPGAPPVMASIRACALAASGFAERMQFYADEYGRIRNIVYFTPETDCTNVKAQPHAVELRTKVKVLQEVDGLQVQVEPRTVRPQQQPGQGGVRGEGGGEKPEEQQSFLRRYWYLVVPGVLFVLLSGAAPEEDGERGGRNGGEGAGSAGGAGGTSGGARQRRTVQARS